MGPWNGRWKLGIIVVLVGLFLFTFGFEWGRRQAFDRSLLWGGSLLKEARALLDEDDDMGLVDWSKRLERDGVVAFKLTRVLALQGGERRILAQGGNERRIPPGLPGPISMLLPSAVLLVVEDRIAEGTLELVLVLPSAVSPLVGGSLFWALGLLCLWGGYCLRSMERKAGPDGPVSVPERPAPPASPPADPLPAQGGAGTDRLLVDQGFKILEMDPAILAVLRLPQGQGRPSHLLDLLPDPAFMQAIAKGGLSEWRGAFPSAPEVLVAWSKVQGGGTLLEFRRPDREGPKIL